MVERYFLDFFWASFLLSWCGNVPSNGVFHSLFRYMRLTDWDMVVESFFLFWQLSLLMMWKCALAPSGSFYECFLFFSFLCSFLLYWCGSVPLNGVFHSFLGLCDFSLTYWDRLWNFFSGFSFLLSWCNCALVPSGSFIMSEARLQYSNWIPSAKKLQSGGLSILPKLRRCRACT